MEQQFSHLNAEGDPRMVDVSAKKITARTAVARAVVVLDEAIMDRLEQDEIHTKKGPVFQTAILAGIMGAKRTSDLIPLCHPIGLDNCTVDIHVNSKREVIIDCTARVEGRTGVEMEALTGASVAALTIYDMCKGFSHDIEIRETKLMKKTGGKRDFERS
jgi:cyclic pyranopterin phosphate synthase